MFLQKGVSYIDSSRGLHSWGWRKDVYDCRTGYRLWGFCECGIWVDLLDNDIVLMTKSSPPGELFVICYFAFQNC